MAIYLDSSFLLSAILEERKDLEDLSIWDRETIRIGSNILKIECVISIRRIKALQKYPESWAEQRLNSLNNYFDHINVKIVDDDIEAIINSEKQLFQCRTLDAIHLATALFFKEYLYEELLICSFDKRLRKTSALLGFCVYPDSI